VLNNALTGDAGRGVFNCLTMDEQKKYLAEKFPWKRWSTVLFFLSSATVFNALLYGGKFPKPNVTDNMFRFYRESFQKLFSEGLARENFFLQLCFFGKIAFPEGVPIEAEKSVFKQMKLGATSCQVDFIQGDLIDTIRELGSGIDFISLSDVPSYFMGDREKYFMQQIRPSLKKGGMVVLRSYRHRPEGMMLDGWEDLTPIWHDRIQKEKVGVYIIEVFRKADG
jgi:S-adenosylmethionine-diacylglycerol 3-amino-3-carboxypropyl transferase